MGNNVASVTQTIARIAVSRAPAGAIATNACGLVPGLRAAHVAGGAVSAANVASETYDLLITGGTVIDPASERNGPADVAIAGGKIAAVGTSEAVRAWIGPKTQVFDLKGLTVTPGLIDSHCHLSTGGAEEHFSLDLRFPTVKSIAEIASQVGETRQQRKKGEWIQGTGWDEGKHAYDRTSWKYQLDAEGNPKRNLTMKDPQSVFQLLRRHYSRYTPEMVERVAGIPKAKFEEVAQLFAGLAVTFGRRVQFGPPGLPFCL